MNTDVPQVTVVSWNYSAGSRHCVADTVQLLAQEGALHRLITNDLKVVDGSFVEVPVKRRLLARLWQAWLRETYKVTNKRMGRPVREKIFDWFAAANLGSPNVVYLDSEGLYRSAIRARTLGAIAVTYQRTANALHAAKILSEEEARLNISKSFYSDLHATRHRLESLRRSDHIIVPSRLLKQGDIESGLDGNKISVVRGCVDTSLYHPPREPSERRGNVVLFVGYEPVTKGMRVLLQAWKQVAATCKDAELWLAGIKPEGDDVPPRVKGLGQIQDMPSIYRQASILAHPAFLDANPKSVTEGMASGLAMVVSRGTGNHEMITDGVNGFVFDTGDHDTLAKHLITLLSDPQLRANFATRARETALKFSHRAHSELILECLEKALHNRDLA